MNKTIVIGIVVGLVVLGGLVWLAQPNQQNNNTASLTLNSGGALTAEEISFDFGTISMAAGDVSHSFKIKNIGAEPVVVGKMYTSCMCTTASFIKNEKKIGPYGMPGHGFIPKIGETINPGEEAIVEVVFDPAAHGPAGIGRIERMVTVENDAGDPLQLGFVVNVIP